MTEENRGIEETKDVIDFVFSLVEEVVKAKKDGEMMHMKHSTFIEPVIKLFEGVDDIEEVMPEIDDLDDEEYDELVEYVKERWDYNEEHLDWIVDTGIEAGRSILTLVNIRS